MLVQLITAKGSVLCGAGVLLLLLFFFFLKGQGEDFPSDHLAEKEREGEEMRGRAAGSYLDHKADLSLKMGGNKRKR